MSGAVNDKRNEAFGERLAGLMNAKGFNQTALAKKTGIERTHLNRLIRGHRQPHTDEIAWLAEALTVTPAELLDGIDLPEKVKRAIDDLTELARRVLAAEGERDEAKAKLAESDARHAADAQRWSQERIELERKLVELRRESEKAARSHAENLAAREEEATAMNNQLAINVWRVEQEKAALVANNNWLHARIKQLEAQLASQQSNAAAAAVGVGGLALLLGIGLGGKS